MNWDALFAFEAAPCAYTAPVTAVFPVTAAFSVPTVQTALLAWFDQRGRDLPWRWGQEGQRDPYRVWVAEILLQQTQVSRGLLYYGRFLAAFPSVQDLANAPIDDVLKAWEGCGYYARARNLHRAASMVAEQGFPGSYQGWLALPGVGPYTAAAIASLALGEKRAVSDGNVRRVLARLLGEKTPTDEWVQQNADALLAPQRPGAWNEAVMDLGATICTPKAPDCAQCPLTAFCQAFQSGEPTQFPAPKIRVAVREVQAVALLIGNAQEAVLEQRSGNLLGGLYGLPSEICGPAETPQQTLARLCQRLDASAGASLGSVTHTMTHRHITLHVYAAEAKRPRQNVAQAALARLDHKALALWERREEGLFGSGF